jgi:fructokinase
MSEAGDPTYTIHEDAAWDHLEFTPELESVMHAVDAVCFGTLAQRAPTSRQTIYECLAATRPDCLRIYDVNLRQQWYRREWIERSLEAATVLKLNESELRVLCSLLDLKVCRPEESGAELRDRFGLDLVCFTCGNGGCLLLGENESVVRPVPEVHVVDAVGAGDAFTAALITARLANWPLETCAEFANSVGALVVSSAGAMPLLRDEYQVLLREQTDAQ